MRIVPNLNEVYFCPNCNNPELYTVKDVRAMKEYKCCLRCHEEIYEGNIPMDNSMLSISAEEAKAHTTKTDSEETARRTQEEKDKFLFNFREEINTLKWHAHTVEDAQLMEHLSFIFTQIADYIENH